MLLVKNVYWIMLINYNNQFPYFDSYFADSFLIFLFLPTYKYVWFLPVKQILLFSLKPNIIVDCIIIILWI